MAELILKPQWSKEALGAVTKQIYQISIPNKEQRSAI